MKIITPPPSVLPLNGCRLTWSRQKLSSRWASTDQHALECTSSRPDWPTWWWRRQCASVSAFGVSISTAIRILTTQLQAHQIGFCLPAGGYSGCRSKDGCCITWWCCAVVNDEMVCVGIFATMILAALVGKNKWTTNLKKRGKNCWLKFLFFKWNIN